MSVDTLNDMQWERLRVTVGADRVEVVLDHAATRNAIDQQMVDELPHLGIHPLPLPRSSSYPSASARVVHHK